MRTPETKIRAIKVTDLLDGLKQEQREILRHITNPKKGEGIGTLDQLIALAAQNPGNVDLSNCMLVIDGLLRNEHTYGLPGGIEEYQIRREGKYYDPLAKIRAERKKVCRNPGGNRKEIRGYAIERRDATLIVNGNTIPQGRNFDLDLLERMYTMHSQGSSVSKIARELSISRQTIYIRLSSVGVSGQKEVVQPVNGDA